MVLHPVGNIAAIFRAVYNYWGLTPQQQPGSYQGGEMMMKSVFWWRKPEYPEYSGREYNISNLFSPVGSIVSPLPGGWWEGDEIRKKPVTRRRSPTLFLRWQGIFYMPSRKDTAGHTNAFDYPVAEHWGGPVREMALEGPRPTWDTQRILVSCTQPLRLTSPQGLMRNLSYLDTWQCNKFAVAFFCNTEIDLSGISL